MRYFQYLLYLDKQDKSCTIAINARKEQHFIVVDVVGTGVPNAMTSTESQDYLQESVGFVME